jgi:hypothetical protein
MFDRERLMAAWLVDYAKLLLADIDESQMGVQPVAGMNTPRWIMGHLCVAIDYAGRILGIEPICPREWVKSFGPGTDPANAPEVPKGELLALFERVVTAVSSAAATASEDRLARPNTFEPVRQAFPTAGDFVAQLLVGHPAMHLGQLSAWRRVMGLKAVLGF